MAATRPGLSRPALLLAAALGLTACTTPGAATDARPAAPALRGTTWQVLPQQAPEMSPSRPAELRLDTEALRYGGFTGCNRITGSFELEGPRLRLAPGGTTRMACLGEGERTEAHFLAALPQVVAWRFEGAELQLLNAAGQPVMRLRAAPTRP